MMKFQQVWLSRAKILNSGTNSMIPFILVWRAYIYPKVPTANVLRLWALCSAVKAKTLQFHGSVGQIVRIRILVPFIAHFVIRFLITMKLDQSQPGNNRLTAGPSLHVNYNCGIVPVPFFLKLYYYEERNRVLNVTYIQAVLDGKSWFANLRSWRPHCDSFWCEQ